MFTLAGRSVQTMDATLSVDGSGFPVPVFSLKLFPEKVEKQASVRAVELFDRLLSSDPRNKDFRFERALRLRAIGEHHTFWDKDPKAAEQAFIAARSALQELSDEFPDNILYAGNLSNVMMNTAVMLADQYRYDEAEPLFEETIRLQTQWLARGKSGYDFQTEMAFSHEAFGVLLWRRDRNPRGEQLCSQARKTFTEFAEKHPRNYEVAWLSARTTLALADMARDAGRLADAEREYRAALARLDAVRRERAAFFKYAVTQLDVAAKLAGVIRDSGRRDEAIIAFKSAAVLAEKLVKEFPAEPVASGANPSVAHIPYAKLLVEAGRHAEADATLRFALKFWPTDAALNEEIRLLGAANSQMGRTD
jgi:tetratricopeptide (TPR) repeat protein